MIETILGTCTDVVGASGRCILLVAAEGNTKLESKSACAVLRIQTIRSNPRFGRSMSSKISITPHSGKGVTERIKLDCSKNTAFVDIPFNAFDENLISSKPIMEVIIQGAEVLDNIAFVSIAFCSYFFQGDGFDVRFSFVLRKSYTIFAQIEPTQQCYYLVNLYS